MKLYYILVFLATSISAYPMPKVNSPVKSGSSSNGGRSGSSSAPIRSSSGSGSNAGKRISKSSGTSGSTKSKSTLPSIGNPAKAKSNSAVNTSKASANSKKEVKSADLPSTDVKDVASKSTKGTSAAPAKERSFIPWDSTFKSPSSGSDDSKTSIFDGMKSIFQSDQDSGNPSTGATSKGDKMPDKKEQGSKSDKDSGNTDSTTASSGKKVDKEPTFWGKGSTSDKGSSTSSSTSTADDQSKSQSYKTGNSQQSSSDSKYAPDSGSKTVQERGIGGLQTIQGASRRKQEIMDGVKSVLPGDEAAQALAIASASGESSMGRDMPTEQNQKDVGKIGTSSQEIGPMRMSRAMLSRLGYSEGDMSKMNNGDYRLAGEAYAKGLKEFGAEGFQVFQRGGGSSYDQYKESGMTGLSNKERESVNKFNDRYESMQKTIMSQGLENGDQVPYLNDGEVSQTKGTGTLNDEGTNG